MVAASVLERPPDDHTLFITLKLLMHILSKNVVF